MYCWTVMHVFFIRVLMSPPLFNTNRWSWSTNTQPWKLITEERQQSYSGECLETLASQKPQVYRQKLLYFNKVDVYVSRAPCHSLNQTQLHSHGLFACRKLGPGVSLLFQPGGGLHLFHPDFFFFFQLIQQLIIT